MRNHTFPRSPAQAKRRTAAVAVSALVLTITGSLAIPASAQASGNRARCTDVLTSYRSTVKAAENGKITNREASTRLARLVESIDDSRTAEAMMAARSLVGDGRDVPRKIDNMIKRRLGNGHC